MKGIFDFQKVIINEFDPEKVSFDSEEVFISCDHGDLADTTVEVKISEHTSLKQSGLGSYFKEIHKSNESEYLATNERLIKFIDKINNLTTS